MIDVPVVLAVNLAAVRAREAGRTADGDDLLRAVLDNGYSDASALLARVGVDPAAVRRAPGSNPSAEVPEILDRAKALARELGDTRARTDHLRS